MYFVTFKDTSSHVIMGFTKPVTFTGISSIVKLNLPLGWVFFLNWQHFQKLQITWFCSQENIKALLASDLENNLFSQRTLFFVLFVLKCINDL